jgi:hypothetical protein
LGPANDRIGVNRYQPVSRPGRPMSAMPPIATRILQRRDWSLWADIVAKRFCASERARLIRDQAPVRNIDSKIHSPRFDRCPFSFYSVSAVTFATISANSGHWFRRRVRLRSTRLSVRWSRCYPCCLATRADERAWRAHGTRGAWCRRIQVIQDGRIKRYWGHQCPILSSG